MTARVLAITWFRHRRTESLSSWFEWDYLVIDTASRGVVRYLQLIPRTVSALVKLRPQILVVQSPSLVLTLLCLILRPMMRYRLLVDAHNETIQPYLYSNMLVRGVSRLCVRRADITIVTNRQLAAIVDAMGGVPHVLPDPIPNPPPTGAESSEFKASDFHVVVISTFAPDEPLAEVFASAKDLGAEFRFSVTGNVDRLSRQMRSLAPDNVVFTGFLKETDYWSLLRSCDVVLDLTLMPNCLVCGAYEAISVSKPLILTSSEAARDWFRGAALYVNNSSPDIVLALLDMRKNLDGWTTRSVQESVRIRLAWERLALSLKERIHS